MKLKKDGSPDLRGISKNRLSHGDNCVGQRAPLYKVWAGILRRCNNPHEKNYVRYGGRGIKVCERWLDYVNFRTDMGGAYRPGLSIERTNNDGNYEPGNCTWETRKVQARNRRSSRFVEYAEERLTLAEWAERLAMPYGTLVQRLNVLKWSVDKAFTHPYGGFIPRKRNAEELSR